jgi:hypothetical protein
VNFLDLDITIVYSDGFADFAFKVYRKSSTAYAYLPYGSYQSRHVFRGWLKAEMHRLLMRSSNPDVRLEECSLAYSHLCNRDYPSKAIDYVSHNQLEPAQQNAGAKEACGKR